MAFLCFLSLVCCAHAALSLSAGSEEAPAGLLAPVLALKDTAQHGGTAHGHRARPRLAWAEEQRTPLEQFSGN